MEENENLLFVLSTKEITVPGYEGMRAISPMYFNEVVNREAQYSKIDGRIEGKIEALEIISGQINYTNEFKNICRSEG